MIKHLDVTESTHPMISSQTKRTLAVRMVGTWCFGQIYTGATDLIGKGQGVVVYPQAVHTSQKHLREFGQELTSIVSARSGERKPHPGHESEKAKLNNELNDVSGEEDAHNCIPASINAA